MTGTPTYDREYQTPELFGQPYKELIHFFTKLPERGTVLDLGCGQGRDCIALANLGYQVTGVDISRIGIEQMIDNAKSLGLTLTGKVADIYNYAIDENYDIVLLDSIFHFAKKDFTKEINLLTRISHSLKKGGLICICVMKNKTRENILKNFFAKSSDSWETANDTYLDYKYKETSSNHSSVMTYNMFIQKKL